MRRAQVLGVFLVVLLGLLCLFRFGLAVEGDDRPALRLSSAQVPVGREAVLELVLERAPTGLREMELVIAVQDDQIAAIRSVEGQAIGGPFFQIVSRTSDVVHVKVINPGTVRRGAEDVVLAVLRLQTLKPGRTAVLLGVRSFLDGQSLRVEPQVTHGELDVIAAGPGPVGPPPLPLQPIGGSLRPPQDLDGDGLYEDINGDGEFTAEDAVLFALHLDDPALRQNEALFDFNRDGAVDRGDAFELARLLEGRQSQPQPLLSPLLPVVLLEGRKLFVGGEEELPLILIRAPRGLQRYAVRIASSNPDVLRLRGVESRGVDPQFLDIVRQGSDVIEFRVADLKDEIQPGAQGVVLAALQVEALSPGRVEIRVDFQTYVDDLGLAVVPVAHGVALRVSAQGIPALPGAAGPPQDLDDDGLFEDVNGDGRLTFDDPVLLAFSLEHEITRENWESFDFNHDGRLDFADAIALAALVEARRS